MRNLSRFFFKLFLLTTVLGAWTSSFAQIIEVESISCPGESDGQLACHADSLTGALTYLWSTGSTENNIKGLTANSYSVTITDGVDIEFYTYNLVNPAPIAVTVTATTPNSLWPANNGDFTINTTGGSGWVEHSVKDSISRITLPTVSGANQTFSSLASGTYFITTTDVQGCQSSTIARVPESMAYGVIDGLRSGIIAPDTTACFNDVVNFSFIPDTIGIQFPVTMVIDGGAPVVAEGYVVAGDTLTMHTGAGTPDVLIDTVAPNAAGYVIALTAPLPPETLPTANIRPSISALPLSPGFHIAEFYTADGRGFRYSWDIIEPSSPLSLNVSNIVHNVCYNPPNPIGAFTVTAEGSYEGITMKSTAPGASAATATASENGFASIRASNLQAGKYQVTATDATTECIRIHYVTIEQPDEDLRIVFDPTKNARCPYSLDGAANLRRVDGAVEPITFSWSKDGATVANTPDLIDITPGTYILTVTDANSCTGSDSIKVDGERRNCFYNIITPNGDGFNDQFDLSDFCVGVQMKAVIFNEAGKKIAELDEVNSTWDAYDPITPPTGTSSTYTCFVTLIENGVKTVEFAESFSVVYPQ